MYTTTNVDKVRKILKIAGDLESLKQLVKVAEHIDKVVWDDVSTQKKASLLHKELTDIDGDSRLTMRYLQCDGYCTTCMHERCTQ